MHYATLEACLIDLEKHGHLLRIREEVDPDLEMAAIHLRVHARQGPALLFENVKGCKYRAASNLFGTLERSRFIFRDTLELVKKAIALKNDPTLALKRPVDFFSTGLHAMNAQPRRTAFSKKIFTAEIQLQDVPQIKHWPQDGGAFITLPQVYTENVLHPGIQQSNIGMYRIQVSGNEYVQNEEAGLHYQLHRGIGIHQTLAQQNNQPLKVSIFVGGPPAHSVAAVMPLPENMSETAFAGMLAGRRFRYAYEAGYCISQDADFVITGEVMPDVLKPEGPFGDHLGYYSLQHLFPVMQIKKVYAKENAIWPFTVVGRPPQEDTSFGALIHEITGTAIQHEIPGLKEVHAVDAAGVHPLLLAIGSERYTPYARDKKPAEILTIANHILGTSQLSLAKYVFIMAADHATVSTKDVPAFLQFMLAKIDTNRDLHFITKTTIDTLDYSGSALNEGSKMIIAAYGENLRQLESEIPVFLHSVDYFSNPVCIMPGIIAMKGGNYVSKEKATSELAAFQNACIPHLAELAGFPMIVICDDPNFLHASLNNFLWVTFTRSNPAQDVSGIGAFIEDKHWGCRGPFIIDARLKPGYPPVLETDPETEKKMDRLFEKGGSLYSVK